VFAEHAASLEMLRHTLLLMEPDPREVEGLLAALRESRYCRLVLAQEPPQPADR